MAAYLPHKERQSGSDKVFAQDDREWVCWS